MFGTKKIDQQQVHVSFCLLAFAKLFAGEMFSRPLGANTHVPCCIVKAISDRSFAVPTVQVWITPQLTGSVVHGGQFPAVHAPQLFDVALVWKPGILTDRSVDGMVEHLPFVFDCHSCFCLFRSKLLPDCLVHCTSDCALFLF